MPFMESPYPVPDCSNLNEEQCWKASLVQLYLVNNNPHQKKKNKLNIFKFKLFQMACCVAFLASVAVVLWVFQRRARAAAERRRRARVAGSPEWTWGDTVGMDLRMANRAQIVKR